MIPLRRRVRPSLAAAVRPSGRAADAQIGYHADEIGGADWQHAGVPCLAQEALTDRIALTPGIAGGMGDPSAPGEFEVVAWAWFYGGDTFVIAAADGTQVGINSARMRVDYVNGAGAQINVTDTEWVISQTWRMMRWQVRWAGPNSGDAVTMRLLFGTEVINEVVHTDGWHPSLNSGLVEVVGATYANNQSWWGKYTNVVFCSRWLTDEEAGRLQADPRRWLWDTSLPVVDGLPLNEGAGSSVTSRDGVAGEITGSSWAALPVGVVGNRWLRPDGSLGDTFGGGAMYMSAQEYMVWPGTWSPGLGDGSLAIYIEDASGWVGVPGVRIVTAVSDDFAEYVQIDYIVSTGTFRATVVNGVAAVDVSYVLGGVPTGPMLLVATREAGQVRLRIATDSGVVASDPADAATLDITGLQVGVGLDQAMVIRRAGAWTLRRAWVSNAGMSAGEAWRWFTEIRSRRW